MMDGRITIWPRLKDPVGRCQSIPWEKLFEQFEGRIDFQGDDHAGWAPTKFKDAKRCIEGVESVHALVLDVDGMWSLPGALEAFGDLYGFIHTSKSHTAEVHRFRIILPLSRPVSAFEYAELWKRFDHRWPARFDPNAKDASRFWYLPGVTSEDAPFEAHHLEGEPLDPDKVLVEPLPEPHREAFDAGPSDARIEQRAIAYIARMPAGISGSGGHVATFRAACALARGFALPEHRVLDLLRSEYNPRCQPAWSEKELRHKARQAVRNARIPMGYLLENDGREMPPEAQHEDRRDWGADEWDAPDSRRDVVAEMQELERLPGDDSDEERQPVPAWERHGVLTMRSILESVHARCIVSQPAPFVSTGVKQLDKIIGGYRRKMITVLGAQTNWGKSSMAIMALDDGIRQGKRVLLVSAEDDSLTYGKRIMARRAGVSALLLRDEVFRGDDAVENLSKIAGEVNRAEHEPWFLDGIGKPAELLAQAAYDIASEGDYDLVVVDYLQALRLRRRTQDRRNDVTEICRIFADAIKSAGAAGLLLSQLRRLDNPNREPTRNDLKESGDIENSAEHVVLGWIDSKAQRPHDEPHFNGPTVLWDRMVKVDKNKDGPKPPGAIAVPYVELTASFQRTAPWPQREDLN